MWCITGGPAVTRKMVDHLVSGLYATVERLERVDHYLSPLLLALWREQHPEAGEQLAFALDAPLEVTTGDLQVVTGLGEVW
jgi:hypothetical protein